MRRRILFLLILVFSSCQMVQAKLLDRALVQKSADGFIDELQARDVVNPTRKYVIKSISPIYNPNSIELIGYCAQLNPKGFIVLSSDNTLEPVIAFSTTSDWIDDPSDENIFYHLIREDLYQRNKMKEWNSSERLVRNKAKWSSLIDASRTQVEAISFQQWPPQNTTSTGGWIETQWHQYFPYNKYCPIDPHTMTRSVTGCVATAMAQIINYHKHINNFHLNDSDNYYYSSVGDTTFIDQDSSRLQFPSFDVLSGMLQNINHKYNNNLDLTDEDVAALNFAAGIAVKMEYSARSSGASHQNVPDAFKQKFGFANAEIITFANNESAYQTIKANIINGLPVQIGILIGGDFEEGHSIVSDGYNTDGFFHLNYGWGSNSVDGWYLMPEKMPAETSLINDAIVNIIPQIKNANIIQTDKETITLPACRVGNRSTEVMMKLYNKGNDPIVVKYIKTTSDFSLITANSQSFDSLAALTIQAGNAADIGICFRPQKTGKIVGGIWILQENGQVIYVGLSGFGIPSQGGTIIEGSVKETEWQRQNSPYYICGKVILQDHFLEIQPGTSLLFMESSSLVIAGSNACLKAKGTETDSIRFKGFDGKNWSGLYFYQNENDHSFEYCHISSVSGHAISLYGNRMTLNYCSIEKNEGSMGCGLNANNSILSVSHTAIFENKASHGGPLALVGGEAFFNNSIIYNNKSEGNGGAFSLLRTKLAMKNCVLFGNKADLGGGAFSFKETSSLDLKNTIVWENHAGICGNTFFLQIIDQFTENAINIRYSLIDTTTGWKCDESNGKSYLVMGPGILCLPPLFSNAMKGDFTLAEDSPCIDAGDPTDDIAEEVYPHGYCVDIGAFGGTKQNTPTTRPLLTVAPNFIDLGTLVPGESAEAWFQIINGTMQTLTINGIKLSDSTRVKLFDQYGTPFPRNVQIVLNPRQPYYVRVVYPTDDQVNGVDKILIEITYNNFLKKTVLVLAEAVKGTKITTSDVTGRWLKKNSPYYVFNSINVPANGYLAIESGVRIVFKGPYSLNICKNARLVANGVMTDSIIFTTDNPAIGWGGLNFIESGSDDQLSYCSFSHAKKSGPGGAINSYETDLRVDNCSFVNCYAAQSGGAIFIRRAGLDSKKQVSIRDCAFLNNTSQMGGAIEISGDDKLSSEASAIMDGCIFINNQGEEGGAVHSRANLIVIKNSIFRDNKAISRGGAISTCESRIENCLFTGNSAKDGAAIVNNGQEAKSNIMCDKITVSRNKAAAGGGAFALFSGSQYQQLIIHNSILWENTAQYGKSFLLPQGYETKITISYSNIDTSTADWHFDLDRSTDIEWDEGNLFQEPNFVEPEKGDFGLSSHSPCIDAGDPADDIGSEPFPHGYRINMGYRAGTKDAEPTSRPSLVCSPVQLEFKQINAGEIHKRKIYLKNGSPYDIHIKSMVVTDSVRFCLHNQDGEIINPETELVVPAGTIDSLSISFDSRFADEKDTTFAVLVFAEEIATIRLPVNISFQKGTEITVSKVEGIWTKEQSPYKIFCNIEVMRNSNLILEPGTNVCFMGEYAVNAYGGFKAIGTKTDSIRFYGRDRQTKWRGIILFDNENHGRPDTLSYCSFTGAKVQNSNDMLFGIQRNIVLENSLFYENQGGEGILRLSPPIIFAGNQYISDPEALSIVENCIFHRNYSTFGGGIYIMDGAPKIINTIIRNCTAEYGGAIAAYTEKTQFINCSIISNSANRRGSMMDCYNSRAVFINSVIYDHHGAEQAGSLIGSGTNNNLKFINSILYGFEYFKAFNAGQTHDTLQFAYSNVDTTSAKWRNRYAGYSPYILWGSGTISADPKFIDPISGNFILNPDSPCIDAGDPDVIYQDPADPLHAGFALYPAQGGVRADMGIHGGMGLRRQTDIQTDVVIAQQPNQYYLRQNYPNPFNSSTVISFDIPIKKYVSLRIYDYIGRLIKILVEQELAEGSYSIQWDGSGLPSGIYYYQIKADQKIEFRKCLLLK